MSKGDTPRPVDKEKYDANFDRIFGKREVKVGPGCPKCGGKVLRRKGFHFDHGYFCSSCDWKGELE